MTEDERKSLVTPQRDFAQYVLKEHPTRQTIGVARRLLGEAITAQEGQNELVNRTIKEAIASVRNNGSTWAPHEAMELVADRIFDGNPYKNPFLESLSPKDKALAMAFCFRMIRPG